MTKVLIVGDYKDSLGGVSVQMKYLNSFFSQTGPLQTEIFSTKSPRLLKPLVFLRLLVKALRFDVINSHGCSYFGFFTVVMCHVASRLLRKRLVIVYHGAAAQDFFDRFPRFKYFLRANQPIIVPSEFLESVFARYGVTSVVIPNAVDLTQFKFTARESLQPRVVSTRNLAPVYNIKAAIDAHVLVQEAYPNASLTIAGQGPLRQELECYVREQAISGVTFLGRVNNADIPRMLVEHDVFINTSLQDNLPVSILEAFASGLPVVSTNVGGIPYLVTDQETGLLVRPDDPQEMAAKILWILNNQTQALAMAKKARESLGKYASDTLRIRWQKCFEARK